MGLKRVLRNPVEGEQTQRLYGLVRDVRTEAKDFRDTLNGLWRASEQPHLAVRATAITTAFGESAGVFDEIDQAIGARFADIRALQDGNPALYDEYGDKISHVENLWRRAANAWREGAEELRVQQGQEQPVAVVPDHVPRVVELLDELVYDIAFVTIPERVNHLLRMMKDGQALLFNDEFKGELPEEEHRKRILSFMRNRPLLIEGVIDAENGIIYRAARSLWRRALLLLFLAVLALGGGFGLVWALCNLGALFNTEGWILKPGDFKETLGIYVFILIGGVAHVAVGAFKAARAGDRSDSLLLDDWLLWVHVNRWAVIGGIAALWIGLLGSVFLLRDQDNIPWETAFLVGYSSDSFADLFLERFNTMATTRTNALRRRLAG